MQLDMIDIPTSSLTVLISLTQYGNQEANKGTDLGAHFIPILQYNMWLLVGLGVGGLEMNINSTELFEDLFLFFKLYACVHVCIEICAYTCKCPWNTEEGVRSAGIGVTVLGTKPLEKHPHALTGRGIFPVS